MCGIAGILGNGNLEVLNKMTQAMSYRGPDDYGHMEDQTNRVFLGHRRLSILDISGGATSNKKKVVKAHYYMLIQHENLSRFKAFFYTVIHSIMGIKKYILTKF